MFIFINYPVLGNNKVEKRMIIHVDFICFFIGIIRKLNDTIYENGFKRYESTCSNRFKNLHCSFVMLGARFYYKKSDRNQSNSKKEWIYLILASIATFGTWTFYFLALKEGSVKNVMTIDRLSIVFAIIFSAIFLKESITYKTIIGMVVFLSGAVLLIYYH